MWNCAHNVGGGIPPLLFLLGMAWFNDWHAALYMPAFGAILLAIFAFAMMRDTPQSCGLPPIEEYKNDYPDDYSEKHEEELTAKQIFMQYILPNKSCCGTSLSLTSSFICCATAFSTGRRPT